MPSAQALLLHEEKEGKEQHHIAGDVEMTDMVELGVAFAGCSDRVRRDDGAGLEASEHTDAAASVAVAVADGIENAERSGYCSTGADCESEHCGYCHGLQWTCYCVAAGIASSGCAKAPL